MRTSSLARHREESERIGVAKVLLGGEREAREIRRRAQVFGADAGLVELAPVVGIVRVRVPERCSQPLALQRAELGGAQPLVGVDLEIIDAARRHFMFLRGPIGPSLGGPVKRHAGKVNMLKKCWTRGSRGLQMDSTGLASERSSHHELRSDHRRREGRDRGNDGSPRSGHRRGRRRVPGGDARRSRSRGGCRRAMPTRAGAGRATKSARPPSTASRTRCTSIWRSWPSFSRASRASRSTAWGRASNYGAEAWARHTASIDLPVEVLSEDETGRVELHRKPLGVVGSITPWNFPVLIAIWHVVPAIRTGNTVVVKPSPLHPAQHHPAGRNAQ